MNNIHVRQLKQTGFTAVELLITLFIAAVFLFAGYQLYTQVIRDGRDADKTAKLSNEVYKRLREALAQATAAQPSGCGTESSSTVSNVNITGVGNVTFLTAIKCPFGTVAPLTDMFLITVTGTYVDTGVTKKVEHATYAS